MKSNPHEKLIFNSKGNQIDSEITLRLLNEAFDKKDAGMVEVAIFEASPPEGYTDKFSIIFGKLLQEDWHFQQENIAIILQGLKAPSTVEYLYNAAELQFDYLNYDDTYQFARKCTWALADIGTPEAKAKLQQLTHSSNKLVAEYAQKWLNHWEEEQSRKGTTN